jgi:hypothetical protein
LEIGQDDSDTARLPEQIEGAIIGEDAGIDRCLGTSRIGRSASSATSPVVRW